jgi:hypothetical protein
MTDEAKIEGVYIPHKPENDPQEHRGPITQQELNEVRAQIAELQAKTAAPANSAPATQATTGTPPPQTPTIEAEISAIQARLSQLESTSIVPTEHFTQLQADHNKLQADHNALVEQLDKAGLVRTPAAPGISEAKK